MSKQSEFYSDLAVSLGLRYDGANNVLYGQRDGFDLMVYPADSRYPYTLSVHTAARSSYVSGKSGYQGAYQKRKSNEFLQAGGQQYHCNFL